jgi:hypothetical protein
MKTLAIVADLDVPGNILSRYIPRRVGGPVHPLDLHRGVERFRQGIIEAYAGPAGRLADAQPLQHGSEIRRCVIAAMPLS